MPVIQPFKAISYNQKKVNLKNVIAPPYDIIQEEYQNKLYEQEENNIVRLILGREVDRYSSAKSYFNKWLQEKILLKEEAPGIYFLAQSFKNIDGKIVTRKGFIALCKIEEFDKKIILPHEKTLSKPKEDRFKLFSSTSANLDQIFSIYSDKEFVVEKIYEKYSSSTPFIEVEFENVLNKVWKIENETYLQTICELLKDKQVFIADGHHRYETSLAYRNFMREQNPNFTGGELFNYVMMFFTNMNEEGLVIFPTHRVVHSLPNYNWEVLKTELQKYFTLEKFQNSQELAQNLSKNIKYTFGIINSKQEYLLLKLKDYSLINTIISGSLPKELCQLDVTLLHSFIFEKLLGITIAAQEKKIYIKYIQNVDDCEKLVFTNEAQIAFLMNPTKIEEVKLIAENSLTMPQKSTFFYPKLVSGLILHSLANGR